MDATERKITKIAREAQRFTSKALRDTGLGLSEYEFIHCVRHNPGISQQGVREKLGLDKAAAARRAANLEKKGMLVRRPDLQDRRGKKLFTTELADSVRNSKAEVEEHFYEWLLEEIVEEEKQVFLSVLDRIYWRSKNERRADFKNLLAREAQQSERTEK